ncbi:MAG: pyruvate kinase [Candidatus Tectomicrobia bacterium]|nr:pyruvate kinase [Candidatus Tectomicrobia bacterium]
MRLTKIVCTLGPASSSEEGIGCLLDAGMEVARLNFAHGSRETHARLIERLRAAAEARGRGVAILQDLRGPKVRVGSIAGGSILLRGGDDVVLTGREIAGTPRELPVSYGDLHTAVRPGDRLLLAEGSIELRVTAVAGQDIHCRIVVGGEISPGKGIHVPNGLPHVPILDAEGREDVAFGVRHGVEYLGLSYVRTRDDVQTLRREIAHRQGGARIIAKIETAAALADLPGILAEADGVMVARGDLGIETPLEEVPHVQRRLIRLARDHAKPVIVATQMLRSMVESPSPTRAEVADIAGAVLDGCDALMLSEETAVGRHPAEAVAMMARIAAAAERHCMLQLNPNRSSDREGEALAAAACSIAAELDAAAIVAATTRGASARLIARHRPRQPLFAVTPRVETWRALALLYGVQPILAQGPAAVRGAVSTAAAAMRRAGLLSAHGGERRLVPVVVFAAPEGGRGSVAVEQLAAGD